MLRLYKIIITLLLPALCVSAQPSVSSSKGIFLEEGADKKASDGVSSAYNYSTGEAIVNSMQRDPFFRVLDQLGMDEINRAITDYELNDLSLVGVVWDVAEPIAMFKAPNGRRYILKSGDKIARNNGFIVSIEHGEVNIKETIVDLAGKRSERTTIKTVKKELVGGGLNERTS